MAPADEARIESGISRLDFILHGGLIKGGMYALYGPPGAGKTILANQQMKTVLVVDDEYDLLHTICATLELGGYHPIPVGNGAAALDAIKTSRPDLMITDVMMPYMSGYGLVVAVRNLPHGETLPVVLMSAMDADLHPQGIWDKLLPKPFSLEALLDTMAELIGEA